jgi:MFS family permease
MDGHAGLGFASLFRSAPVAALAALLFGAVETGAFSVLPVYGHRIGLDDRAAAMQISAVALGNLFFQIPFGLLADRVDKRRLLLLIAGLAGLVTLVIPFLSPLSWLYLGTLCLWGGVAASLYCVGLALLGAQFHGASLVAANALFVMLYATGQMFGPPLLGWAMDMVNPHGYIWASASLFGLYIAIVLGFGQPKSG